MFNNKLKDIKDVFNDTNNTKSIINYKNAGFELTELKDVGYKINELIKFEVKIFILSSSINPEDVEKAKNNNLVTNYFAKPLMMDGILAIKEMYS